MCKGCMENSLQDFVAISHCCKTSALARMSNENNFHCNIFPLAFTVVRLFVFHCGFFGCLNDSDERKYSLRELFVGSDESIAFLTGFMCGPVLRSSNGVMRDPGLHLSN